MSRVNASNWPFPLGIARALVGGDFGIVYRVHGGTSWGYDAAGRGLEATGLRPQGALRVLRFVGKGGVHGVGTVVFAVSAYVGRPGVKNMGLGSQLYKLCARSLPVTSKS